MDIKVYTDTLEGHILQQLSILRPTTKYGKSIGCNITCHPGSSNKEMFAEWTIHKLLPRYGIPSYGWAKQLHKDLRKFPCLSRLQIKYNLARTSWNATHYYWHSNNWNTGLPYTWENLEANNGGMICFGQAGIPIPVEASDRVTVKLEWIFEAEGGIE